MRRYGAWMREEAQKRIGHLYPQIEVTAEMANERPDLKPLVGQKLTVIAWLWARTVKSPNPAFSHVDVPLASTFVLSSKAGKEAYVHVEKIEGSVVGDSATQLNPKTLSPNSSFNSSPYRFTVRMGTPPEEAKNGTKISRGAFRCLLSDIPIKYEYIDDEANAGRMGAKLMAIVAEGVRGRVYLAPTAEHEAIARQAEPTWRPETACRGTFASNAQGRIYGFKVFGDYFTPRQLVALTTFSDLVAEAMAKVKADALAAGMTDPGSSPGQAGKGLDAGGTGATAYAQAVGVYLAFAADRMTDSHSALTSWTSQRDTLRNTFARQALPMVWDYAEANPFSDSTGNFSSALGWVDKALDSFPAKPEGNVNQADAQTQTVSANKLISTDPPYYDNIGYADLSDFFYVWLRRSLRGIYPNLFATLAVPKAEELVATPYRHGSKEKAESFFLDGMTAAMHNLAERAHPAFPVTIYYAFKQAETKGDAGTSSTGWETFLEAVLKAGFALTGTWPMRTEREGRTISSGTNTLASSIVLVCRQRAADAPTVSRREFIRELNATLPEALDEMTRGKKSGDTVSGDNLTSTNYSLSPVSPVDLSQAIIGPGMAIFSQYAAVLEADGKPMSVRTALQLINRFLAEDDFDHDTQFCLAWFEQQGWAQGKYGDADVLARAKGTSVGGLVEGGVVESSGGSLRLLKWAELPRDWSPETDTRTSVWEALHHLIRALNQDGESAAGSLLARMPSRAEPARALAYRLYTLCERQGWAEEARAYNELVNAWSGIEQAAGEVGLSGEQLEFEV